ncbi:MAG TPA: MurR/RpiR family transcriptional regulator [Falsiroseomonas sp.]|jgi:DNA-binding MurR/RpiR family transcriptional regulator|nr:MurR/RpiR family transcriptional regulator [Falsiroseomonas sp.]
MHSMRSIAEKAGVAPATLLRLARRLGLDDYGDLRGICRDRVRDNTRSVPFSHRGRALQARDGAGQGGGFAPDLFIAETRNLEPTLGGDVDDRLDTAVSLLIEARRVLLVARRTCYPVGCCFHYAYSLFRPNGALLEDRAGSFAPELLDIAPADVLLAVSFEPYSTETITAVELAHAAGAPIIAITDVGFSPLARVAEVSFIVGNGSPTFLQSIVVATALVQALATKVFIRAGQEAAMALEKKEALLRARGAYRDGRAARRSTQRLNPRSARADDARAPAAQDGRMTNGR